jgi:phosphoglycolate phosphatase
MTLIQPAETGHPLSRTDRLLVLDLDGTVADTLEDLRTCACRMLARRDLPPIGPDEIRPMIGDGVTALVDRVLISRGLRPDERAVNAFMTDYAINAAVDSRLFPGIASLLDNARHAGWRLAICTNKPVAAARSLLAALDVEPAFATIGGGDSFSSRKPDPAHLLGTIARAGGDRSRAIMVGDHRNDISAARRAGVGSIFAAWGYGDTDMQEGADAVADRPADVLALAERLLAAPVRAPSTPW